jgi:transcriptional regulator with XRE-family HTH domain
VTSLGSNIRRLREAGGHPNQGAFAKLLGVRQPRLSDWENGRYKTLKLSNLILIAKTLKISVDALLAGVDEEYERYRVPTPHNGVTGSTHEEKAELGLTLTDQADVQEGTNSSHVGATTVGVPSNGSAKSPANHSAERYTDLDLGLDLRRIVEVYLRAATNELSDLSKRLMHSAAGLQPPASQRDRPHRVDRPAGVRRHAPRKKRRK